MLATIVLLAACGGDDDDEPGEETQVRACSPEPPSSDEWTGSIEDPATGEIDVAPFNEFLSDADPPVSTSPCDAARVLLHLDQPGEEGVTVDVAVEPEDAADATVTVTEENLPDDSVNATRWELDFAAQDGAVRLASAAVSYRCQPGRGQQDFEPELCV